MNKAKLLVLSSFPAPYRVEIFKGLANEYDNMDIFFGYATDSNRDKDYYVVSSDLPFFVLGYPNSDNYLKKCVSNLKEYSLILAYDWYLPYAWGILLKAIRLRVPYIINCDGAFLPTRRSLKQVIKDIGKRILVSSARYCFASGEYAKKYFLYYGANEENIIIHHFTSLKENDIKKEAISKSRKDYLKKNLQLKNRKTVITVGQFIYRKGFDILLAAWKDLDKKYQLIILGGGELEGEYRRYIERYYYQNVFLLGFMPKEDLFKYYEASDIFVLPTREDIWGLVINEAMACGLPVITTEKCIAGMENIDNGVNGFIVPTENPETLHDKMEYLLVNDVEREKMGYAGLDTITGYTLQNVVNSHLQCINQILKTGKIKK